ncbi:rhodanese-like domain-containing protein [Hydrogenophaga sp.]|uniref:rhodanese-like domain-containing protein n=1 Tax=Hydrogenophaga sp. TaxID=1904254 RepID=UPI00199FF5A4|nr:rhodanese-like domain-containing protein [Hydrogenophaga sp.]MBD3892473.1 sulfurtransferase [Hydrogenophaga sp.]
MISIAPAQFQHWLQQAKTQTAPGALPIVLDVREPWEVQTASVKPDGFELRLMPMASVSARHLELDRQQPIACLCHHGRRSAQVAQFLQENGFSRVVNIDGGIHDWSQQFDTSVPVY